MVGIFEDLVLRKKPCNYINKLNELNGKRNGFYIARQYDMDICYSYRILKQAEESGLVIKEKNGRESKLTITDKGIKLVNYINKIKQILNEVRNYETRS